MADLPHNTSRDSSMVPPSLLSTLWLELTYDKADWKKGREELSTRITYDSSLSALSTKDNLEGTVDRLVAVFVGVLQENVARA